MKGIITKVHRMRTGENFKVLFMRVEFRLENGNWAKTDLCPDYNNFARWKNMIEVGTTVGGMKVNGNEVDADSPVILVAKPITRPQMELFH